MNDTNANKRRRFLKVCKCNLLFHYHPSIRPLNSLCNFHFICKASILLALNSGVACYSDTARREEGSGPLKPNFQPAATWTLTSYLTFHNNQFPSSSLSLTHNQNGIRRPRTSRNRSLARPTPPPPLPHRNPHRPRYVPTYSPKIQCRDPKKAPSQTSPS
jgi:hypothetical protein